MRKILIVGAGQAGLQLALSLQARGYDVTVLSARTPDEMRGGWPTSTQVMWPGRPPTWKRSRPRTVSRRRPPGSRGGGRALKFEA